jgi:hypothetical protein
MAYESRPYTGRVAGEIRLQGLLDGLRIETGHSACGTANSSQRHKACSMAYESRHLPRAFSSRSGDCKAQGVTRPARWPTNRDCPHCGDWNTLATDSHKACSMAYESRRMGPRGRLPRRWSQGLLDGLRIETRAHGPPREQGLLDGLRIETSPVHPSSDGVQVSQGLLDGLRIETLPRTSRSQGLLDGLRIETFGQSTWKVWPCCVTSWKRTNRPSRSPTTKTLFGIVRILLTARASLSLLCTSPHAVGAGPGREAPAHTGMTLILSSTDGASSRVSCMFL